MLFYGEGYEFELKVGGDFLEKICIVNNMIFGIIYCGIVDDFIYGLCLDEIFVYDNINNDVFYVSLIGFGIFDDRIIDGDKYSVVYKLDVYYFMVDYFLDNIWCIIGGVCWEDFV